MKSLKKFTLGSKIFFYLIENKNEATSDIINNDNIAYYDNLVITNQIVITDIK